MGLNRHPTMAFGKSREDFDASYVVWEPENSHGQNIHFLHGALHIFDAGSEIQKYTWNNTGVRLIEQIRNALTKEYYHSVCCRRN